MSAIGLIESLILNRLPRFMRGPNLGRWIKSYALSLDDSLAALELGLTSDNPLLCPAECLPAIAKDRGLRIYPTEPEWSQRTRLSKWLQLHRQRGSQQGVLRHMQPYFLGADGTAPVPRMRTVHQDGNGLVTWHTLDPDGHYSWALGAANWDFDGHAEKWSRFWVIIYDTTPSGVEVPCLHVGEAHYDDGVATYDDGITIYDWLAVGTARDLAAMADDWHAAHSQLAGVIIAHDLGDFDPAQAPSVGPEGWSNFPIGGNWQYIVDPDTNLPTRNQRASFIYENA